MLIPCVAQASLEEVLAAGAMGPGCLGPPLPPPPLLEPQRVTASRHEDHDANTRPSQPERPVAGHGRARIPTGRDDGAASQPQREDGEGVRSAWSAPTGGPQ